MKINLILLASGNSKRFNGNKLLTNFHDKPLYMYTLEKLKSIKGLNQIIVVTQYEEIKQKSIDLGFDVVLNFESELGISNSIALGISRDKSADGYMFMVCDQPFIKPKSINKLIEEFNSGGKGICSIGFKDRLGNPNIFSRKYLEELLSLKGDIGGKHILKKHIDDLKIIQIEDGEELKDIDTRDDIDSKSTNKIT